MIFFIEVKCYLFKLTTSALPLGKTGMYSLSIYSGFDPKEGTTAVAAERWKSYQSQLFGGYYSIPPAHGHTNQLRAYYAYNIKSRKFFITLFLELHS